MYGMSEQDFVFSHCCNMVVHHPNTSPSGRLPQDSFPSAPFSPVPVSAQEKNEFFQSQDNSFDKHVVVVEVKYKL